jgi:hypothetical protein
MEIGHPLCIMGNVRFSCFFWWSSVQERGQEHVKSVHSLLLLL